MTMGGRHSRKPWPNQPGAALDGSWFAYAWFFCGWAALIVVSVFYFMGYFDA